jgi:uncharacterized membrane protein YcaP (DUF421 family)
MPGHSGGIAAMFALQIPGWQIVVRTVVVYLAVSVGLRFLGKRELGQMTVFEFVVILLVAARTPSRMPGRT